MQAISNTPELDLVSGGDNPSMGPYDEGPGNGGQACGNSMLFWGGVGSGFGSVLGSIGGVGGSVVGFFGGGAGGGWFASRLPVCQK